jgi:hypothetical protein
VRCSNRDGDPNRARRYAIRDPIQATWAIRSRDEDRDTALQLSRSTPTTYVCHVMRWPSTRDVDLQFQIPPNSNIWTILMSCSTATPAFSTPLTMKGTRAHIDIHPRPCHTSPVVYWRYPSALARPPLGFCYVRSHDLSRWVWFPLPALFDCAQHSQALP